MPGDGPVASKEIYEACAIANIRVEGLLPIPGDPPTGGVLLLARRPRAALP